MIAAAAATTASEGGTVVDDAHDDDCTVVLYCTVCSVFCHLPVIFQFQMLETHTQAKGTKIGENAKITI